MYKLSDEVISQIAKLVQLAIITGTDIVDNLRTIEVEPSEKEGKFLNLTSEYRTICENNLEKLLEEVSALSDQEGSLS
tara:strand:- start:425 stop:658 length:234 start_codon:yes stop_codon:yes gene_type:complete